MAVCHICKCIYAGAGTALTVSTMMHGEYGIEDVCLSTLTLVDRQGVRGKIANHLTDGEIEQMRDFLYQFLDIAGDELDKELLKRRPKADVGRSDH